jgi:predicted nucleic acid-binding protein
MVLFDAGFLSILYHPNPRVPADPATGNPPSFSKERIEYLIDSLSDDGEKILIPTPALAEVLMALGKGGAQAIASLHGEAVFRIVGFDERAAIELALMSETIRGEKKRKEQAGTWAKVKFDRQIVAIAKVNKVRAVYSTDGDVLALARREGLRGFACHDLPIPPPKNMELFDEQNPQTE